MSIAVALRTNYYGMKYTRTLQLSSAVDVCLSVYFESLLVQFDYLLYKVVLFFSSCTMQYRQLGNTDIKVSEICLGTMTWGRQNTEQEAHEQIEYSLNRGINFIDTAELYAIPPTPDTYGKTETIIGSWMLKNRQKREKIILATKISGPGPTWIRDDKNKINRDNIISACEDSLRRLHTDYIDLYQLHWPNRPNFQFGKLWKYSPVNVDKKEVEQNFIEVLQTLNELMQQGKIRHVGLSNESSWGTMMYLHLSEKMNLPRMVSIQNEYNLLNRQFEPDLAETSMRENIGLLAWSPLATGLLTGKYLTNHQIRGAVFNKSDNNNIEDFPEGTRWSILKHMNAKIYRNTEQAAMATLEYVNLAKRHEIRPEHLALSFVVSQPFLTSCIIGATNMDQLKTNLNYSNVTINRELLEEIRAIRKRYPVPY